jgi:hypothetical protein
MNLVVLQRSFLIDFVDRYVDTVDVDGTTPIEAFADRLCVKVGLFVRELWAMKKNTVLNYSPNIVAGVRPTWTFSSKEISVDCGNTVGSCIAHGAWRLYTTIYFVVRETNFERVVSSNEREHVDGRSHSIGATTD